MIFPYLRGLVAPQLAPLTYFFIALNLVVFVQSFEAIQRFDSEMNQLIRDDLFLETQGEVFASIIDSDPLKFSSVLREIKNRVISGDQESRRVLGSLALRNSIFMNSAVNHEIQGDEVALSKWREQLSNLIRLQDYHPSFQWGLSESLHTSQQWITYQFAHGGFVHLFWNMLFLLLFGVFVEVHLGKSFVAMAYLGGGIFGALAYSEYSGLSSSPLVGASAAVSALIGLVTFRFWRQKLPFFYWFLPARGYYGKTALPTWVVLLLFLAPDLSGALAAVPEIEAIAYSAHLGGMTWGLVLAVAVNCGYLVSEINEVAP